MAFEIIRPRHFTPHRLTGHPPARRVSSVLFGAVAVAALVWACVVAYHAKPVESEQEQSAPSGATVVRTAP